MPQMVFAHEYDAATNSVKIPIADDRRYRHGLWRAASTVPKAAWFIHRALRNGPSTKGAAETMRFYGTNLEIMMYATAPIVDALEVAMPGFKQWIVVTGFGNDLTMFKGFVRWAEARPLFTGVQEIIPASKVVLQ
jgi:hypothetical protein